MSTVLSCHKCDYETTEEILKMCPHCGTRLQSKRKVRILGWLLVILGSLLVIFMGGLGIALGGIIARSGQPGQTTRFTGGPEEVAFIALIFGLVISFGIAAVAGGVWQIWFGKRNTVLMIIMFLVAGLLFVIATLVRG